MTSKIILCLFSICLMLSILIDPDVKTMASIGGTNYLRSRKIARSLALIGTCGILFLTLFP